MDKLHSKEFFVLYTMLVSNGFSIVLRFIDACKLFSLKNFFIRRFFIYIHLRKMSVSTEGGS